MKTTTPTQINVARRLTAIALNDLSQLSSYELIRIADELHALLDQSGGFSRPAQIGVRRIALDRLLEIDREHQRRLDQAA